MPTSNLRVLLVEDDDYKVRALSEFIKEEWPKVSLVVARSLNSAVKEVASGGSFSAALVDMSLPTYDLASDRHGGGEPEGFAGEDILRFIESHSPDTLVVVVTQLSEFSDGSITRTLDELTESLRQEMGPNYLGLVRYSGRHGVWRESLRKMFSGALE